MIINKISSCVKIPYPAVKGTVTKRQAKANALVENLYGKLKPEIKDDYSIFTYEQLNKNIRETLPDRDFSIIIRNLTKEDSANCEGICEVLYNKDKDIKAIAIGMNGIESTIRSVHIPAFMHEVQHVTDDIYHPKYLSRLQGMNKRGLLNKKYDNFYDTYYYSPEVVENKQDKKDALKIIKNRTKKFLRRLSIHQKMDYIQDMRYSLISEIEAYKTQRTIAKDLKSKGIQIKDFDLENYPKDGLFEEKVNLLKELAMEYLTKERAKHASRLKKNK